MVVEDEKRALMDVERVLVRIRSMAIDARLAGDSEALERILRRIELLADAAHNIPRLVANRGDAGDSFATDDNLRFYASECRQSLLGDRG
ncbi:hypothetical protein A8H39_01175 [Paraburkholderia fungorum]|uniref:hypothetical protein n=1 Tax=Paraburkholderia fungorum TaxID=134537 RepID=UPI0004885C07|nr:hypothetical protein [Paraburkholderia fungorum]PNE59788.1 hypothetical protein A8H39_01175 [Paraburkholderia fungorum]